MATAARSSSRPASRRRRSCRTSSTRPRAQLGRIDILVCNAASNPYYGPMGGISDDQFRKILENNVHRQSLADPDGRAARCSSARQGSIIIVSSIGGLKASAVIGAYNISKAADFQLARNLAAEFGPRQVRVNCIAPGLIQHRFRAGAVGKSGDAEGGDDAHAAAADRRAARNRRRGGVPRVATPRPS